MHNSQTTSTQSLMDRYYEEEKAQQERELSLAELNVRLDANDLAMLNVISKRFRKTRDEVAQELLSSALIDLFSRLESTERKLLARDADEAARSLADEIAEDNGVRTIDVKTGVWANHERQLTKIERKLAKQAEQQANEAQQETSTSTETTEQTVSNIEHSIEEPITESSNETATVHSSDTESEQNISAMAANQ